MKDPRIFGKAGYFFLAFHLPGVKNAVRRSTHIPLDIKYKAGNPLWWHKSEHKKELEIIVKKIKADRQEIILKEEWGVSPSEIRPLRAPPIDDLLKEFNEANTDEEGTRSPRTLEARYYAVRFLKSFDRNAKIESLTPQYVRSLRRWAENEALNGKGYAPKSIRVYFTELNALWRYAWRERYISRELDNPFERITIDVPKTKKRRVPIEEQYEFFRAMYELNRPLFYQAMFERLSGFRVSEVINYGAKQIDMKNNNLLYWNAKPKRDEVMPISRAMAAFLKMYISYAPEAFGNNRLFAYNSRHTVSNYLKKIWQYLGIEKINPHLLKACYIQEIRRHCPTSSVFAALCHHAAEENRIAVEYYLDEEREEMLQALNAAQDHWIGFFRSLKNIPEQKAPFNWGKPKNERAQNRHKIKTAPRRKPSKLPLKPA